MSIRQLITCAICGKEQIEKKAGEGFVGWGALQGISLDGEENPNLCPNHLSILAVELDNIKNFGEI